MRAEFQLQAREEVEAMREAVRGAEAAEAKVEVEEARAEAEAARGAAEAARAEAEAARPKATRVEASLRSRKPRGSGSPAGFAPLTSQPSRRPTPSASRPPT